VKAIVPFIAFVLLLSACERQQGRGVSPAGSTASKLPGVWVAREVGPSGTSIDNTLDIGSDGSYTGASTIHTRTNGVGHVEWQGFYRIDGGFLIDTVTNTSLANASVPETNRAQIIRIDDKEMILAPEKPPGVTFEIKQIVFSRKTQ
jgi:hypothetical protein